ncbi:hypothetical protein [Nitrospira sp. Kam-Ns4a]
MDSFCSAADEAVLATGLAGAGGALLKKEVSGEALVRAARAVAAGRSILNPTVTGPVRGTVLLFAGTAETVLDDVTLLSFYALGWARRF